MNDRVAALYDIHGNLPALEAVLDEVGASGVTRVIVGGDLMPGPLAAECLELLDGLDMPVDFISGNGEREVLAVRDGQAAAALPPAVLETLRWSASRLDDGAAARVRGWPATLRRAVPGVGDVLFCHATPKSDRDIVTRRTPEAKAAPGFEGVEADLVVAGHVHMQFERRIGGLRLVNAGSVGMPFGEPGAHWLLLGPDVEPRRTGYDPEAAAERLRASDDPGAPGFADRQVLGPPSEEEALRMLEPSVVGEGAA